MSFGLTDAGFILKRLADIKTEMEAEYREKFGDQVDLSDEGPLGQLIGMWAEREALLWELLDDGYNSQYPDTAQGVSLDQVASINNITRLPATKSTVTLRWQGTPGTAVPIGNAASVADDETSRYESTAAGVIGATGINETQTISFSATPGSGDWTVTFDGQTTGSLAWNISAASLKTALELLTTINTVTVTGSMAAGFLIEFTGADGQKEQTLIVEATNTLAGPAAVITIAETQKGYLPYIDLAAEAAETGPTPGAQFSITVLETPVAGITAVNNPAAADIGRDVETDAALRTRRKNSLQRAGSATVEGIRNKILEVDNVDQALVVENTSMITVGGIPAKAFESTVQGGDEDEIAEAIFSSKPAGIEAHGSVTKTVTDEQGIDHTIKFSRPTDVPIYFVANITPNTDVFEGALYPSNGDALVAAALVAAGALLQIGQDVWNTKMISSIGANVPGIKELTLLQGIAPGPATSANITIAVTERATIDLADITVNS